ncbi:ABC transporter ATP-binding protein [Methylocystis bryophila]|uniref:ABC transporter ATP-binding protein n=1 Tax=Methylocystis bryophila TaxID=655015 RepID=A0A1W6MSC2_9HYPH|nr:ABC transporter ATP-binding protein [Methylocystis bryophila]ARN80436.1 ABC transporter ATP-binding protein [Methylocystis bryophila]BDV40447.1 ABC transporter ATP-binding protein [Methylocystis bryophila]
MTATETLLELRDVEASYNQAIVALRDVSLKVRRGEIVALLGANGSGKTTILNATSRLLAAERGQITSGKILFDGRSTSKSSTAELAQKGLVQVLEGRRVFRSLTVEENLASGALARRSNRRELRDDLDYVYGVFPQLKHRRRSLAGLLSGGEQQMTAIGRAMMTHPRLLILDEPSMGLAPLVVEEIYQVLGALNRMKGLSLLVAEQNAYVALRHAHRGYVVENGVVVLEGAAATLQEREDVKDFYLGRNTRAHRRESPTRTNYAAV